MSISNQQQAPDPLRGTRWLCELINARPTKSPMGRLACVQVLALVAFAFILVVSIQFADSASLTPVGKHRSGRDRGCYYLLQHYRNGEQIRTDEPCLNCTCENSRLMCYLQVCPYVKPVGDKCIIERVAGECCPRITCAGVAPPADSFEQDTIEPETSTLAPSGADENASTSSPNGSEGEQSGQDSATLTASSLFDVSFTNATTTSLSNNAELAAKSGGCMLAGQFYPEGAQMPADASKSCEICYCIRSSAACVMQDCALEVSGCAPIYAPAGCCPTRYNCSAEHAFTRARPKTLPGADTSQKRRKFWDLSPSRSTTPMASEGVTSLLGMGLSGSAGGGSPQPLAEPEFGRRGSSASSRPAAGCKAPNSTRVFADGERVPSRNKCEHCYCMRGELVCAVQECRPPCHGCVPIIDSQDQCCPKRYECAAPMQRVPADNLIVEQQDPAISATSGQHDQEAASGSPSAPTISSSAYNSTLAPPLDASTSPELAPPTGSDTNQENSVMATRQTKPPLRPISPKLSTTADEEVASEVVLPRDEPPPRQANASAGSQVSNVDGFNLNGGEREQEASEVGKSAGRVEAPEGSLGTSQQDSNEIQHSPSGTSSTGAPTEMVSDGPANSLPPSQPDKTIIVTSMPASPPMDGMNLVSGDRKPRPLVVPSQIPGEGSCRYKGRVYQNGAEIKSDQPCAGLCMCINSVVYCDEIDCPSPPENEDKCQKIREQGVCCPKYLCPEETSTTSTTTSTPNPPVEAKTDTTRLSEQPQEVATSSTSAPSTVSSEQAGEMSPSSQFSANPSGPSASPTPTETPSSSVQPESPNSTEASLEEVKKSSYTEPSIPFTETSTTTTPAMASTSISPNHSSSQSTGGGEPPSSFTNELGGSLNAPVQAEAPTTTSGPTLEKSSESSAGSTLSGEQSITSTTGPPASFNEVAISSGWPSQEASSGAPSSQRGEQGASGQETNSESSTTPSVSVILNSLTSTPTEPTSSSPASPEQAASPTSEQPSIKESSTNQSIGLATTFEPISELSPKAESPSTNVGPTSAQSEAATELTPPQAGISDTAVSDSTTTTTTTPPPQTNTSSLANQESVVTSTPASEASSSSLAPVEVNASSALTSTQAPEVSSAEVGNKAPEDPQTSAIPTDSGVGEPVATSTVLPDGSLSSSVAPNESVLAETSEGSSTPASEVANTRQAPVETSTQTIEPSSERPSEGPGVNLIETVGSSDAPLELDRSSSTAAPIEAQTERTSVTSSTDLPASSSPAPEESSTPASSGADASAGQTTPVEPVAASESEADRSRTSDDTSKAAQSESGRSTDPTTTTTTDPPITSEQTVSSSPSPSQSPAEPTSVSTLDVSPSSTESTSSELTTSGSLANEPQTETTSDQPETESSSSESSISSSSAPPSAPELSTSLSSSPAEELAFSSTTEAPQSSTNFAEVPTETPTTTQSGETSAAPNLTKSRAEEPKMSGSGESFSREPIVDLGSSTSAPTSAPQATQPSSSVWSEAASSPSSTSPPETRSELSKSDQDPAQNVVATSSEQLTTSTADSADNKQGSGSIEVPVIATSGSEKSTHENSQATSVTEATSPPTPSDSSSTAGGLTDETAARTNEHNSPSAPEDSTDSPSTSEKGILTTIMDFVTGAPSSAGNDVTPSPTSKQIETSSELSNASAAAAAVAEIEKSGQDAASSTLAPSSNVPEQTNSPSEVASISSMVSAEVTPETRSESTPSAAHEQLASSTAPSETQNNGNSFSKSATVSESSPASDSATSTTAAPQTVSETSKEIEVAGTPDATTDSSTMRASEASTSAPENATSSGFTQAPSSSENTKIEPTLAIETSSTVSAGPNASSEMQPAEWPVNNVIETSAKSDSGEQSSPLMTSTTSTTPEPESQSSSTTEAHTELSGANASEATSPAPVDSTSPVSAISEKPSEPASVETKSEAPTPVGSSSISNETPTEPTTERSAVSSFESSSAEVEASSSPGPSVTESEATQVLSGSSSSVSPAVLTESRVEEPKMIDVAKSFSMDPGAETNVTTSPEPASKSLTTQGTETTTIQTTGAPTHTEPVEISTSGSELDLASSPQPAASDQETMLSAVQDVMQPKVFEKDKNVLDTGASSTAAAPTETASSITSDQSSPSTVDSATPESTKTTTSQWPELSSDAPVDSSPTSESSSTQTSTNAPESPSSSSAAPERVFPESRSEQPSNASEASVIEEAGGASTASAKTAESEQVLNGQESASTSTLAPSSSPETSTSASSAEPSNEIGPQSASSTAVTEHSTTLASPASSTSLQSSLEMDSSSVSELANATSASEPPTEGAEQAVVDVTSTTAAPSSAPPARDDGERGFEAEKPARSATSGEQASTFNSPAAPSEGEARSSVASESPSMTSADSTATPPEASSSESPSSFASSTNEVDSAGSSGGLSSTVMSNITTTTTAEPHTPEAPSTTTTTTKPSELESPSSTAAPEASSSSSSSQTTMSPADQFITAVSAIKAADFAPVNLTTTLPSIRGVASSVTIPWTDIANATSSSTSSPLQSSEASSAQPEVKHELATNGTRSNSGIDGGPPTSSPAPASTSESDYEEVTDEPGCEYEGKSYSSAQQIARAHPCDFCFCFRGDIICLQQTCPPPVSHCFETVIDGFCCPRYECPVNTVSSLPNSAGLTLTPYQTHSRLHNHLHDPPSSNSTVRGCYLDNKLVPVGKVIESASGPCLECLCDPSGFMKCNPKECTPEDPLLQQINREVLQSGASRNQRRRR